MTYDLKLHSFRLLFNEPFFATISKYITKIPSKQIPTAGVRVNPHSANVELLYNPDFMESLSEIHARGVLKHEIYHVVLQHITDRLPAPEFMKLWNFATDLAINSHIADELPEMCLLPGRAPFEKMPLGKSSEWYFREMMENPEKYFDMSQDGEGDLVAPPGMKNPGSSGSSPSQGKDGKPYFFDDHSTWNDGSGEGQEIPKEIADIAREKMREVMKKGANEVMKSSNGWGSVPQHLQKQIMDFIKPQIDWKAALRYFVKASQKASHSSSIRRINKRYPYIHPGRKIQRVANIAISIDQSGSVGDELLEKFFSELNGLSKYATFTVIPFDHEVFNEHVYVWKKGQKRRAERVLCGGTDFDAPTSYINERSFDGHIILTDMCAPAPRSSKCQRMWLTSEMYEGNMYYDPRPRERVLFVK